MLIPMKKIETFKVEHKATSMGQSGQTSYSLHEINQLQHVIHILMPLHPPFIAYHGTQMA